MARATAARGGARRFAAAALLALSLIGGTLDACAQEPVAIAAAAKSFKLGALDISVLRDGALNIPNDGSIFGLNAKPADVAAVLRAAGAPTDKIRLDIDALLIRMPKHVVLVDTGYGPGHGHLLASLAAAGATPADVTDIFITHAHPDHVGGLVDAQGKPAFPAATIRLSAKEWAHMQSEAGTGKEAAAIAAQVVTFEPGKPVLPGITPIALYGHTPGHVGYRIESQGHALIDIGDIAHSSIVSLARPGWTILWDGDKAEGVKTRTRELGRLATSHELMFAPHFPFPGVGHIEKAGHGFRFEPGLPTGK